MQDTQIEVHIETETERDERKIWETLETDERKFFGCKDFCNVICPQCDRIAVETIRSMIELVVRTTNLAKRVKKMLHSLHWLLCATMADFSDVSDGDDDRNGKTVATQTNLEYQCQETVVTKAAEHEKQRDAVTFQSLPPECKVKVFSYLTMQEKGRTELVCSEWRDLMRTRSLWSSIDLTRFLLHCKCPGGTCSNAACYNAYKDRTEQFLVCLAGIQPILKELRFAFDINDCQDDWLNVLRSFIGAVSLQKLELAQLNWKETPVKPYPSESAATWSSNNYNDLMYRHRRRQRHFVGFFDYFTASATNLRTLILPFDWSACSIRCLSRLHRLESLVLESYFVPQPLQQETFDDLLRVLPNLKRLTMTVCIGSGLGMLTYKVASKSLRSLDLSCCQGFCLDEVCLPSLTEFRTSCKPYACPLLDAASTPIHAPCIYEVLCDGAPSLVRLNDHRLRPDWRENRYEDLEAVLSNICTCPTHKTV